MALLALLGVRSQRAIALSFVVRKRDGVFMSASEVRLLTMPGDCSTRSHQGAMFGNLIARRIPQ
jgi:hypothetical protein